MKQLIYSILIAVTIGLASCHHVEEWDNDVQGNFDALWQVLDEHYCFFEQKGIDWDSTYRVYSQKLNSESNLIDLYNVCAAMVNSLEDGHVNLTAPFATTYYKGWWSKYPQNYDERLVEEYYLHFGGLKRSGITYTMFEDSVGYLRYPSFALPVGNNTLDWALMLLRDCHGLIIDIRDNGGGNISEVETFVARFIDHTITAGYIQHKTGPGHNDFSEPYAFYYDPAEEGRIRWDKPVVVLTNRSTFSAANNFASIMATLPQVTLIGDCTGGGSGMPFTSEIPCGWSIRFSASPVYDPDMRLTEHGVEPDIHVDLDPEAALEGHDTILDRAIEYLNNLHAQNK